MIGEYQKGFLIGKGVDAKCYLATKSNHTYCIKMIPILMKEDSKRRNTQKEIEALTKLQNHENIITMIESFATHDEVSGDSCHYIITEAMKMNLEQFLRLKKGAISENICKKISFQVMNALNFCHLNLITHQDIKLENITIDPNTLRVKLIDFGYCSISQNEKEITKLHETQGTPLYLSPEKFLFKKYDGRKSDAWSCGVLIYKLVTGYFPFGEDCKTLKELYGSILSNEYKRPSDCTPHFIDLVDCLLHKNPKERISVNTALQHSWFSQSSNSKVKRNSLVDKLFRGSRNRSKHNSITNC